MPRKRTSRKGTVVLRRFFKKYWPILLFIGTGLFIAGTIALSGGIMVGAIAALPFVIQLATAFPALPITVTAVAGILIAATALIAGTLGALGAWGIKTLVYRLTKEDNGTANASTHSTHKPRVIIPLRQPRLSTTSSQHIIPKLVLTPSAKPPPAVEKITSQHPSENPTETALTSTSKKSSESDSSGTATPEKTTPASSEESSESEQDIAAAKQQLTNLFDENSLAKLPQRFEDAARGLYMKCISSKPLELSNVRVSLYQKIGLFQANVSITTMRTIIASTLELQGDKLVLRTSK